MVGKSVIIEEVKTDSERPIILEGLPDIGLVGTISLTHYLAKLGFKKTGYLQTQEFPPVLIIRDGKMSDVFEIYYKDNVYILRSELPIPQRGVYEIVDEIVNWVKSKNPRLFLSLGGIPDPYRIDVSDPKVYGIPTNEEALSILSKMKNVELLSDGFIFGPKALILRKLERLGITGLGLFVQSYLNYPDPGSAAKVLTILPQIGLEKVEVDSLIASAEEIRMQYRELMRRTDDEIRRMRQVQPIAEQLV
ncbi:MAG: PAC2 family protein [Thermoproteota archaeon]|nr:proteasome assembly chaperone family protein [Candidatus Brockarchaeota archaeon]